MSAAVMTFADQTDPRPEFHGASVPAIRCWAPPVLKVSLAARRSSLLRSVPDADDTVADEQARRLVTGLCRGIIEVLDGRRSCAQLTRWCCSEVLTSVEVWHRATGRQRLQLASVRVMLPHPGAVEAVARLRNGDRTLAAVLRLDLSRGHWLCTAFDVLAPGREWRH